FDRYIREHAKLLDVGAAHRIGRSVIENVYDRGGARRFLNSLLVVSANKDQIVSNQPGRRAGREQRISKLLNCLLENTAR
ncbi:hypothetical protein, partial [Rhodanobacter sp. C06]|uniref:hypothetical protein n=1 Tax=Rhodanobacter sp. C06 TaxID=1945854 RepID=UPI001C2C592C